MVELDLDGGHVLATPVSAGGAPAGWLAVMSRRAPPSPRLARQAARATAPCSRRWAASTSIAREQQRAVRAALLDEMLKPHVAARPRRRSRHAAASLGIDFATPARVVLDRARAGGATGARTDLGAGARRS